MDAQSSLQPSRRAIALLAAGLVLAVLPALLSAVLWPLWLAFCGLVALACGADAVLCARAGQLQLESDVPKVLAMTAVGEAVFRIRIPSPWPVGAEATLDVGESLEPVAAVQGRLGAEDGRFVLRLVPRRRGEARIETLWLAYDAPLGLMRRTLRFELGLTVDVVPDLGFVRSVAFQLSNVRDAAIGLKIERYPGDGTEFDSLREFVAGHDPRSIDWKASARHTRLLAREYRAERNHQIVLALDTGRLMAEPIDGAPLVDHAIHAALALAYVSLRHGDRVSLFAFDERPHTYSPPRGGPGAMPAFFQLTSRLDYSRAETNFTLGLTELSTRLARRSLVVVLTDFVDSVTAELMVENLLRLNRRHLILFAALRDPLLEARRDVEPRVLDELHQAVVADSLLRERELVIRRLGKAGVTVIDTAPRRLGPELINRYLKIKQREMI